MCFKIGGVPRLKKNTVLRAKKANIPLLLGSMVKTTAYQIKLQEFLKHRNFRDFTFLSLFLLKKIHENNVLPVTFKQMGKEPGGGS